MKNSFWNNGFKISKVFDEIYKSKFQISNMFPFFEVKIEFL